MFKYFLQIQILCRPPIVLVLGGRKFVVANECTQHIMPERLMLIAIAVVDLKGLEIISEDALGAGQETGAVLNLLVNHHNGLVGKLLVEDDERDGLCAV